MIVLCLRSPLSDADRRRARLALIEHLAQWNIGAYLSHRDPLAVVVSTPTPREEVARRMDGMGDLWQFADDGPEMRPTPRRPGKWCLCGRRLASDNVTGYCLSCLYAHRRQEQPDTSKRRQRREQARQSRHKLGRKCSACGKPICDGNKAGICATCRSVAGDPRWPEIVASAAVLFAWELRIKWDIGREKAEKARAEARRRM